MTSPPVIVRGVIVVGSSVFDWWGKRPSPPGDVRGFDVATGRLLWTFHTVPQGEEPGVETWEKDSWKEAGNANVWAPMSADEELGYVYLPVTTPTNDYYGGHRPGDGLYGESLVCIEATTGKKVWHYQLVHHGLWDYDPPAAPNLIDITVDGKRIKAVAQPTKQAFLYVFDRVTGKPVWPIEEQPVPASTVPGSRLRGRNPFRQACGVRPAERARRRPDRLTPEITRRRSTSPTPSTAAAYLRRRRSAAPSRCPALPAAPAGPARRSIPIPACSMSAPIARRRYHYQKPEPWQGTYDFIGKTQYLFSGPTRSTAVEAAVRQHRRHRHEHRRAPLAHSGRPHQCHARRSAASVRGQSGRAGAKLGADHQDGHGRRADGIFSAAALGARIQFSRSPTSSISIRICGSMTRRPAKSSPSSRCRQRNGSPITYMAGGKQFIAFPVGGGARLAEELIAVRIALGAAYAFALLVGQLWVSSPHRGTSDRTHRRAACRPRAARDRRRTCATARARPRAGRRLRRQLEPRGVGGAHDPRQAASSAGVASPNSSIILRTCKARRDGSRTRFRCRRVRR